MVKMIFSYDTINKDVIEINNDKVISERAKYFIHYPYKGSWGIIISGGLDQPFK